MVNFFFKMTESSFYAEYRNYLTDYSGINYYLEMAIKN
jgi:hypothetical protein